MYAKRDAHLPLICIARSTDSKAPAAAAPGYQLNETPIIGPLKLRSLIVLPDFIS